MRALLLIAIAAALTFHCINAYTADDLSLLQCTANDVEINGPGILVNEPCECPDGGTFNATVRFNITNKAQERYCFTFYFCDAARTVTALTTTLGRGTGLYDVNFPFYKCSYQGLQCFGYEPNNTLAGYAFPKGTECPAGQCCSGIDYDVNEPIVCPLQPPDKLIPSKCRYAALCIQSKYVNLTCNKNCNADVCGEYDAEFTVCEQGFTGPATFSLVDSNGKVLASQNNVATSCYTFTIHVNSSVTVIGKVAQGNCYRHSTGIALNVNPLFYIELSKNFTGCSGSGTFTVTPSGGTGAPVVTFYVNGVAQTGLANQLVLPWLPHLDGKCYQIVAKGHDSKGCNAPDVSTTISQCVSNTFSCTYP